MYADLFSCDSRKPRFDPCPMPDELLMFSVTFSKCDSVGEKVATNVAQVARDCTSTMRSVAQSGTKLRHAVRRLTPTGDATLREGFDRLLLCGVA